MAKVTLILLLSSIFLWGDNFIWSQKQQKNKVLVSELDKKIIESSKKSGAKMFIVDARSGEILDSSKLRSSTQQIQSNPKSNVSKNKVPFEIEEERLEVR